MTSIAAAAPDLAGVLEQRVPQELAAEGVVLGRLGVALDVEIIGDRCVVSLVDQTTHRASASTKIDALPADAEAAVALVTQVAANLASQLVVRPPAADAQTDDRIAEQRYQAEALGFGDEILVGGTGGNVGSTREWYAHQGELKVRLDEPRFYELVGRPDLAATYRARHDRMIGYATATGALLAASAALGLKAIWTAGHPDESRCGEFDFDCHAAADDAAVDHARPYAVAAGLAFAGMAATMFVSLHYYRNRHPVTEDEAKGLAARHNHDLRRRLGLPTAELVPYAAPSGGGLTVSGQF
jgi:hypothetical protein